MPERRDSADSYDDFFGLPSKPDNPHQASPKPNTTQESTIAALINAQTTVKPSKAAVSPSPSPSPSPEPRVKSPEDSPIISKSNQTPSSSMTRIALFRR
jgi:hypothetical protein